MLNSFTAIGRLPADAMLETDDQEEPLCIFVLDIERPHRKGEYVRSDRVPCQITGARATALHPFLTAGTLLGICGRLGSDGGQLFVVVEETQFLARPSLRRQQEMLEEVLGG